VGSQEEPRNSRKEKSIDLLEKKRTHLSKIDSNRGENVGTVGAFSVKKRSDQGEEELESEVHLWGEEVAGSVQNKMKTASAP